MEPLGYGVKTPCKPPRRQVACSTLNPKPQPPRCFATRALLMDPFKGTPIDPLLNPYLWIPLKEPLKIRHTFRYYPKAPKGVMGFLGEGSGFAG